MLPAEAVDEIAGAAWFTRTTRPYLVVDDDLRIRAVNRRYEEATGHPRSVLLGEAIFEVFPDNPGDATADGVASLSASFERVFIRGEPHWMGVQRYDVPDLSAAGRFVQKVWAPVNSPIHRDGRTAGILHHVEDVTSAAQAADAGSPAERLDLLDHAQRLWQEFPALSFSAVIGAVASSHQMVFQALGSPHGECAEMLARLRLQQLVGHRQPHPDPGPLEKELRTFIDNGFELLDGDDCLRLLASQTIGRVAVTIGALPAIFPVSYHVHGNSIYFRIKGGTKLSAALAHGVVAFEVDLIDPVDRSGWSVQVLGRPRLVSRLDSFGPGIGGERDHLVRIDVEMISGRRISQGVPES